MNTFKTPKGTTLPLFQIERRKKNKQTGEWTTLPPQDYLEVKYRLIWFKEEQPTWALNTEILQLTDRYAAVKATVFNDLGRQISSGIQDCTIDEFQCFLAKAETSAIGRALAHAGFGTQFTDDLEEGERLADAPVSRNAPTAAVRTSPQAPSAVVGTTSNKWDADAAKNFKADPTKLASPAQVGRLLKLCEVHQWDKQKASDLSYNKYGKARFSDLNRAEYDWICDKIQKSNYLDTMRELNDSTKAMLASNPPSAQFDENNPPPITDEDVPFL